jgi:tetratricopeptide (TPR) repeat protein
VRVQLLLKAVNPFVVTGCLALCLYGQDNAPPQGGQAPPPQQTPQPQQPRQPTPQPTFPTQGQQQPLTIRGRILADANTIFQMTEVRFETDGGQPMGFAYTDSGGEFRFERTAGFSTDQTIYVMVKVDGFKPYRERLGGPFGISAFDSFLTIFLERENVVTVPAKGGAAVVDIKQLRAKVPGKAVDEYEKALKEFSKGNRDKAVEGLQRAIKLAPDFFEAQHTLGVQYFALQRYDDAESALLKARDLNPKSAEPLMNLGSLYYQRGERQSDAGNAEEAERAFQKSVEFLEESIRRNQLSPAAHSYLGAALYKIGEYERAEAALQRALDLDQDQHDARLMLVNVYAKEARYSDALEQSNIYLAKFPKSPQRPAIEKAKAQLEKVLADAK